MSIASPLAAPSPCTHLGPPRRSFPPSLLTELEEWDAHWRAVKRDKQEAAARTAAAESAARGLLRAVVSTAPLPCAVKRSPSDLPSPSSVLQARLSEIESAPSTPRASSLARSEHDDDSDSQPRSPRSCARAPSPGRAANPVDLMDAAWWYGRADDADDWC